MTDRGDLISILKKRVRPEQFVIGNDETELELSVESRSFVNRVNDQVRKRQKIIFNVTEDGERLWLLQWNQQYSWARIT